MNEIESIISKLEESNIDKSYIVLKSEGGNPWETHITMNKEGLDYLILELLKIKKDNDFSIDKDSNYYDFNLECIDDESDIYFDYLIIKERSSAPIESSKNNPTIKDNLVGIGCFLLFIAVIIIFIVGLVTVFN